MTALLQVTNISRRFGGLLALKDVTFSVDHDRILGLIGPNGAGKTTCFNVISGLIPPSSGTVRFKGKDIVGMKPSKIVRDGLARTFQSTNVFPGATVIENVIRGAFARMPVSIVRGWAQTSEERKMMWETKERCGAIIDRLSLTAFREELAGSLPYGHQKLLGLAIALAGEPALLMLDEPAAGLNPEETLRMGDIIKGINRNEKVAIVLVEHHMRLVMGICDHLVVLDHGEMLATGSPAEIKGNAKVIEAYLGTEMVA
jgi:branched-chain amino acid transport system ATP-binding protein